MLDVDEEQQQLLQQQLLEAARAIVTCPLCGPGSSEFKSMKGRAQHNHNVHKRFLPFECQACKKLFIEEMCRNIYKSNLTWKLILLRYFNPLGAHPSGYMDEDPRGIPNILMPTCNKLLLEGCIDSFWK